MKFLEAVKKGVLILDGAMGTEIVRRHRGKVPMGEILNREQPQLILSIHRDYLEAGADIIETNTFSLNRFKAEEAGLGRKFLDLLKRGIALAREAAKDRAFVAGSVGPLGKLLQPLGELYWEEAYEAYYEVFSTMAQEGVDILQAETMVDIEEAKIASMAAKEAAPHIPLILSVTFTEEGRTVTGSDPQTAFSVLSKTPAEVLSANCGREVEEFLSIADVLSKIGKPFAIYPNAGLPVKRDGELFYPMGPQAFSDYGEKFYQKGASIVGGCCGTTPQHIRELAARLKGRPPSPRPSPSQFFFLASRTGTLPIGYGFPFRIVGERINPFGSKKLKPLIEARDIEAIAQEAVHQERQGAEALDVNLGREGEGSPEFFSSTLREITTRIRIPIFIDVKNLSSAEAAFKATPGRAALNSCTAEKERMEKVLPLVKKYYGAVVAIAIDEEGVAETAEKKIKALEKFIRTAEDLGLSPSDIIFDPVVLSVSTGAQGVRETLKAIEEAKKNFSLPIILGLSNVSYGMPGRKTLNRAFLAMAIAMGADAAIMSVSEENVKAAMASELLLGRANRFMELFSRKPEAVSATRGPTTSPEEALRYAILDGNKAEAYSLVLKLLEKMQPMEIMNKILIPAMKEVGDLYEKKIYFLPQLIASAEAMKKASSLIESRLKGEGQRKWKIVMATVKGDLHDIGKNIAKAVFSNFGFHVVDLGKNVPLERIMEAVERERPHAVGLSCLMTTSLDEMERATKEIKKKWPEVKVVLGGATVTPRLVREFGADIYAKDAVDGLNKLKEALEGGHKGKD